MTLDILRSGYAVLQDELAQEKASALGRLGRRLEDALAALAACPREDSDRETRRKLVEQAGYALWLFVVQRESCGFNDSVRMMRQYGVPKEVFARMGPMVARQPTQSGRTE
ncbi:DUF6665 family protein [Afipia sp. GAS231]|uniref:DUF6665 family protein n=1 Tax=Afipia sp. GAS231 TaxID=1882747 RepID=UPI00087BBA08|nr:DUF6665 family protein [Afipia sp. GAS231]SDP16050.1 hypothetical protein SAMN05444050_6000 [Afipia sp. GAS231]